MASGAIHSNRIHNTGIRFFCIEMGRPWRNRANGHLESLRGLTHFDEGLLPWLAMRLYREFRAEDEVAPLAIEGLVLELLAGVARQSSHSEKGTTRWVQKARDFVHDRFQESISLAEVADFAEVHPVSLARAFRRTYHCTVGDYVRKLRIEFACQKLTGSNLPARNSPGRMHRSSKLLSLRAFPSRATFLTRVRMMEDQGVQHYGHEGQYSSRGCGSLCLWASSHTQFVRAT